MPRDSAGFTVTNAEMPDGFGAPDFAATVARLSAELDAEASRLGVPRAKLDADLSRLRSPDAAPALQPISAADFLQMQITPRRHVLAPVLPIPGLAMLYAPRGMGKTYAALSIACAIATGGTALRWRAPEARRVLYIDGEMPAADLQTRLAGIVRGAGTVLPGKDQLRFLAADLLPDGLPSIARPETQSALDRVAEGADVLILDNLSSLAGGLRENEGDDWEPIQRWMLSIRRAGKTALLVHHAGKGGQQRGTSRREDVLDTVLALRRPGDYEPTQGARFEVHVEKGRGVSGRDAEPFLAALIQTEHGGLSWTVTGLADDQRIRAEDMIRSGVPLRDIADECGLSKSAVHRMKKQMDRERPADGV